ncbi:hypothetical protein PAHAL_7G145000 [Panicum hallii]|uniref:Uncharacterized protein n=1 Tax=Panicum hallii TaxID=206008 RepID=A0A2T8ICC7_9POAL|nr:hypothetical protein PAHAL_7G145000 [Panicum hallii]
MALQKQPFLFCILFSLQKQPMPYVYIWLELVIGSVKRNYCFGTLSCARRRDRHAGRRPRRLARSPGRRPPPTSRFKRRPPPPSSSSFPISLQTVGAGPSSSLARDRRRDPVPRPLVPGGRGRRNTPPPPSRAGSGRGREGITPALLEDGALIARGSVVAMSKGGTGRPQGAATPRAAASGRAGGQAAGWYRVGGPSGNSELQTDSVQPDNVRGAGRCILVVPRPGKRKKMKINTRGRMTRKTSCQRSTAFSASSNVQVQHVRCREMYIV